MKFRELRNVLDIRPLRLQITKRLPVSTKTADDFSLYHLITEDKTNKRLHKNKTAGKRAMYLCRSFI